MSEYILLTIRSWQNAWANKVFRRSLILAITLIVIAGVTTSFFFNYMEDSKLGVHLNDWVLKNLPAIDVSAFIVTLVTCAMAYMTIRCGTNPNMFLTLMWAYVFQLTFRIVTISATRFYAPPELIVLKDPFGSVLYHSRFITRDLFFSGHTAFIFMFFLCLPKKREKIVMLIAALTLGCLLLVQHVHYTVDVIMAPPFAFACFWLAKRVIGFQHAYVEFKDDDIAPGN